MYISLDRTVGRSQLGCKGDMTCRGVLEIVFKTPEMHIPPWYWFSLRLFFPSTSSWPSGVPRMPVHACFHPLVHLRESKTQEPPHPVGGKVLRLDPSIDGVSGHLQMGSNVCDTDPTFFSRHVPPTPRKKTYKTQQEYTTVGIRRQLSYNYTHGKAVAGFCVVRVRWTRLFEQNQGGVK